MLIINAFRGLPYMPYLTVSEAADRLGAKPQDISNLLYRRVLRTDLCPLKGGRRMIPETYLDQIAAALRRERRQVNIA